MASLKDNGRGGHGAMKTGGVPADRLLPQVLFVLLAALIVYIPNQAQIPIDTGIRGINVSNILFAVALVVMSMIGRPPAEPTPLKLPFLLLFGLIAWAFIVALVGDATAWVEDVTVFKNSVFYLLLYFLFYHAVRDARTVRLLLLVLLFVIFTSTVLGVRQALDYGIGEFNDAKRVAAPFGWEVFDANRSAIYFCVLLQFVAAGAFFMTSRPWLRLACLVILAAGVFAVFHTYSRQAYFILALLLLLVAARKHVFVAVLAALALFKYDLWVPESVIQRIEMTTVDAFELKTYRPAPPAFDTPVVINHPMYGEVINFHAQSPAATISRAEKTDSDEPKFDESTESRFTLWAGAWALIQSQPLGIGLNRFKREIGAHVPAGLAGKDAHNFFVLVTTEAGVFAPFVMVVFIGGLLWLGFRLAAEEGEESRAFGIGFVLATLAMVLGNVYGSRFLDGEVLGNYWIAAGLAARMLKLKEAEARLQREKAAGTRSGYARFGRPSDWKPGALPVTRRLGAPQVSSRSPWRTPSRQGGET